MYDVIIVGGGPAGLGTALYAARYNLKTVILSKIMGGAITGAHKVENYPGFDSISGLEMTKKFEEQVKNQGVEIINEDVRGITKKDDHFIVNNEIKGKKIILCLGTARRNLGVPGEKEFAGRGVSYCATCDAPFFRDKTVGVIGGGNSAVRAAQLLAEHAKKVYIIYRRDAMRAEPVLIQQIEKDPKIEIIYNTNVTEIKGDKFVTSCTFDSGEEFMVDGVFIEIGSVPSTSLAKELGVELDDNDFIKVDDSMRTNIKGVYAAGDITTASNGWRQVITACAEGGIAATSAYQDIKKEA